MSFEYRLATRADNEAILVFIGRHAMQSKLRLRFDRSPDFFALADAHSDRHETWLMWRGGHIVALGSLIIRPGYVGGIAEPVVYLSDLRVAPGKEIAGRWRTYFLERMEQIAAETHARYAFCAVIRDNRLALNSIVRQRSLGFQHLRGYSTVSVLGRKPFHGHNTYAVRQASASDFGRLSEVLDRDSRTQVFAPVFDHGELQRRLDRWPGLGIDDFIVAINAADDIVGCVAPWDYSELKRVVIDALPGSANWLRLAFNLLAPVHGRAQIPPAPGAVLPDIALSHLAVHERDPEIFAALLLSAMRREVRGRRAATVSLCLYDTDPLWPALADYWHYAVPMDLYSLRIAADAPELHVAETSLPGFEFYLA